MVCGKQGKHRFYVTYDTFAYQLLRRLFKYMCIIIQNVFMLHRSEALVILSSTKPTKYIFWCSLSEKYCDLTPKHNYPVFECQLYMLHALESVRGFGFDYFFAGSTSIMVCGKQGKHRFYVTYETFAYQLLRRPFKYMCIIIQNDLHSKNIPYTCSNTHVTNVHNYDDIERQAS